MSSTTATKVSARDEARRRLAERQEQQRRAERANSDDLVEILKAAGVQAAAATKRDEAIANAHALYESAVVDSRATMGKHLAAMNGRGVPANELADLVGDITVTEVRRLIKAHKKYVNHHGDTAAGESSVGSSEALGGLGSGSGAQAAPPGSNAVPAATERA